jgi:hypothetical protein
MLQNVVLERTLYSKSFEPVVERSLLYSGVEDTQPRATESLQGAEEVNFGDLETLFRWSQINF